jgi:hypothetical protein
LRPLRNLTYANAVSTVALFLALSGGIAFAASKIGTRSIERDAVTTSRIAPRAVTGKRLALDAVRSKQIAPRAVGSSQIASEAVGPGEQKFPVYFVGSPTGGSAQISGGTDPYPLDDSSWTQNPGEINVVFGAATATLAYDGSGSGSCQVYFDIRINDEQAGGGEIQTDSTSPVEVNGSLGAEPSIDPLTSQQNELTVQVGSNGDCQSGSTIDSSRFRVLDFG